MEHDLLAALRRWWGYDAFLPLQERIVQSIIAGHDVAAVLPTGGGKSLCYQLPALVLGRTAVVISPLIALMQDQAAQLRQMGIPAAVLNSSLPAREQHEITQNAIRGAYRLVYLSPERLARADTIPWLQRAPVAFFAIDEAHCISEWGHEFRPEYRQLRCLKERFPDRPIAAFTASATRRVRQDILDQLGLRAPDKYIRSFLRPNLRYLVRQCDAATQQRLLLRALRAHAGESVIVYAPTIATVESTVDLLAEKGIAAIPYHAQMSTEERRKNQERWTSDEIRVLVGTIAFGLGINKPAVRAVIHLSLPKSLEQYYQESGRAGRDGQPSDCLLLWQVKDAILIRYFIEKMQDADERDRSWQRYREMRRFAETAHCRKQQVCFHFGEKPKWQRCEMCDNCGTIPDWVEKRVAASPQPKPAAPVTATPAAPATPPPPPPQPVDSELLDYLRAWRRQVSRRENLPAYIVLHDSALEDLSRRRPSTMRELTAVFGIGEAKAERYGEEILAALAAYARGERAAVSPEPVSSPAEETLRLLGEGKSFEEIAGLRGRQPSTIVGTVALLIETGRTALQAGWVRPESRTSIEEAAARLGLKWLKPIRAAVPEQVTDAEIRLVMAELRRLGAVAKNGA